MAIRSEFVYKPSVKFRVDRAGERQEALLLEHLFNLEPERSLRRMPGRETLLARISMIEEGARIVIKRFENGAGREGWWERLRGRRVRSEGRREFETLTDLATVGIPVPRAIRYCESPQASSLAPLRSADRTRSAVLMECVEHFEDARQVLERSTGPSRRAFARSLLAIVRRLHERGWIHRDLYLQHFIIPCGADRGPVLIDVARARWSSQPGRRWLVKDLAALQLSAPTTVTRTERLRFLRGWLAGQGRQAQNEWKRWARWVDSKSRKLGAHRPRFDDPDETVGVEPLSTLPNHQTSGGGLPQHAQSVEGQARE